jgi:SMODS domain-containing protein
MTAEWRNVTGRFQNFIGNLQPTPQERQRAQAAAGDVAACLDWRFRPDPAFGDGNTQTFRIIGGHAKGTAVRPARTVDMLYILPMEKRPGAGDSATPGSLLNDMASTLSREFATQEATDGGWLWVKSLDGTTVRLIPCYSSGIDKLMVAEPGSGEWRAIDPASESARLYEANLAGDGKATHLVMMLKAWRRHRMIPLGSFALELLVSEFVLAWTFPRRSLLFYDWMVRDFFFWMIHQHSRELLTPGALETVGVGNEWTQEVSHAHAHAQAACAFERENDIAATIEWQAVFGPAFTGELPAISSKVARSGESGESPDAYLSSERSKRLS